jgi:hypothetical protein
VFISVPTEVGQTEAEEIGGCLGWCLPPVMLPAGCRDHGPGVSHISRHRLNITHVSLAAGVEHLLRDVKDATISTLATDVSAKLLVSGCDGWGAAGLVIQLALAAQQLLCSVPCFWLRHIGLDTIYPHQFGPALCTCNGVLYWSLATVTGTGDLRRH